MHIICVYMRDNMQPTSLFENGLNGLSNSKYSGIQGSAYRVVGVDFHSEPGILKAHQKLTKVSGDVVTELCKERVAVSDGSILWFSSESGKVWRELNGTFTLIHTIQRSDADEFPITNSTDLRMFFRDEDNQAVSFVSSINVQTLNPSGNIPPRIVSSKRITGISPLNTISTSITANTNNTIIISAGSFGDETEPITTVLINGNPVTTAGGSSGVSSSWEYELSQFRYVPITNGTQTINVTYAGNTPNRFLYVLVLEGANTTVSSGSGLSSGTSVVAEDITQLVNQIHISFCLSRTDAKHVPDSGQINLLSDSIGRDQWNGRVSVGYKKAPAITNEVITQGAMEFDGDVYYAVQSVLYKCPVVNLDTNFTSEVVGLFANQSGNSHTMALQNLQLFIADGQIIAKVDEDKSFVAETNFNLKAPEVITTIQDMDIDILVGTVVGDQNKGRVLRWDTESESWYAEDTIEERGVNAFIRDDNFTYVQAGDFGKIFFYNGEQLIPSLNIPGEYSPTKRVTINQSSVTTLLGIPRFGLSNLEGNPQLQGVYSFGSYSKDYPKVLDLSFPISNGEMEGVTIGGVVSKGADMWVSWKQGTSVGIDKLDYSAKLPVSYIETMVLTNGISRTNLVAISKFFANYNSLPTGTNVNFGIKKAYESDYTNLGVINDTKRLQVRSEELQTSIAAPQVKISLISSGNQSPMIESIIV